MKEIIKQILNQTVLAPSGDNSQPWYFKLKDDGFFVYLSLGGDDSFYNYKERGSYIAIGALIENATIIAGDLGFETQIKLFPEQNQGALIAELIFSANDTKKTGLAEQISLRVTNRKPYVKKRLSEENKEVLLNLRKESSINKFLILEDKTKIDLLSSVLNLNERLILENKKIHDGLFKFIRWSKIEEEKSMDGMYIKTLELAPPQEKAFKLFRKWKVISFLNHFGVSKMVAKDSAKLYASTPAYGLISVSGLNTDELILSGRFFQRVWLTATKLGLSLQPVAAILFLAQRISGGDRTGFSAEQIDLIKKAETKIKEIFSLPQDETPLMIFRLGFAEPPSATSIKRPPIVQ